jgi:hypothetical protein
MDKAAFADTDSESPWWLLETVIDPILLEPRKDLGQALGYDRDSEWYREVWRLEAFYDQLESASMALLAELDQATDTSKQSEWLEKVIALLGPEKTDQGGGAAATPPATAPRPTAWKAAQPRDAAAPRRDIFGHARAEATADSAAESKAAPDAAAGVDRAVQQVIATQLGDTNHAALAQQLGITEQQVAELLQQLPDDFEQLVAQRAAEIVSSRA